MALRCIQYFAEQNATRFEVMKIKAKIPLLLEAIENNDMLLGMGVGEVIELATVFMNYLKIPDFLFSNITQKLERADIEKLNKRVLRRFVYGLMDRHRDMYTYDIFNKDEFDYNNKWSKDTLDVIRLLLTRLAKSKFSSNVLLSMKLASNKQIFNDIVPQESTRVQVIDQLFKNFNNILNNSHGSFRLEYIKDALLISSECDQSGVVLDKPISFFLQRISPAIIQYIKDAPKSADSLEYMYLILRTLGRLGDMKHSVNMSIKNQYISLFTNLIMPEIMGKCQSLVHEIMYDQEVKQQFNSNLFLSDFSQSELLPSIIQMTGIKLNDGEKANLRSLFERTSKRWSGELLLTNLIFVRDQGVVKDYSRSLLTRSIKIACQMFSACSTTILRKRSSFQGHFLSHRIYSRFSTDSSPQSRLFNPHGAKIRQILQNRPKSPPRNLRLHSAKTTTRISLWFSLQCWHRW